MCNVFQVEELRLKLNSNITVTASNNIRIFLIYDFFESLLKLTPAAAASYFSEFLPVYILLLKKYEAFYKSPVLTEKIITQLKIIKKQFPIGDESDIIINRLEARLAELYEVLRGRGIVSEKNITFPVLEEGLDNDDFLYGFPESFSIEIKKSTVHDEFIIIPSEQEIDIHLEEQVKISWELSLKTLRHYYKRIHKFHKVIVHFDNRLGFYSGNSFGTALTLNFIEELFRFYNANHQIKTEGTVSFTGGIDHTGKIISSAKEIIVKKTQLLFYSGVSKFVVPDNDRIYAEEILHELSEEYPLRNPEIIGVKDLQDLLNRRNIIAINKKNLARRTGEMIRKQWVPILLAGVIVLLIFYSGLWDFDNNPYKLDNKGMFLRVLNKNNKVLWEVFAGYDLKDPAGWVSLINHQGIIDIDRDGKNEVFLCPYNSDDYRNVVCYDASGDVIWKYLFQDTVSTAAEHIPTTYRSHIIGVTEVNGEDILFLKALNEYATSAIYSVKLKSGERCGDVLWHHGHINIALLDDFNKDRVDEIVALGINNGFERSVMFSIDIDKIAGRSPSKEGYEYFRRMADFNKYILLPGGDMRNYLQVRFNHPAALAFDKESDEFRFYIAEDSVNSMTIGYNSSSDLENIRITMTDKFQVVRDSLVAKGILNLPYSDTREYKEMLAAEIVYKLK